jgi:hypothetical protein
MKAIIKGLKSDCTFNQRIAPFGDQAETYYSLDLTAATDRIPVQVYLPILERLFGKEYTSAWHYILTGLPFTYQGKDYSYACGQPKGMYSSWAMLAVAHHLIVRFSASRVGIHDFSDYRVLGDDVVIRNTLVANSYLKVKAGFGVEISKGKSIVSKDAFSFAKRYFNAGREITAFPIIASKQPNWVNLYTVIEIA